MLKVVYFYKAVLKTPPTFKAANMTTFLFEVNQYVFLIGRNIRSQHPLGYKITQRFMRRGQPSYRLLEAQFPTHEHCIYFEQELIAAGPAGQILEQLFEPWPEVDDNISEAEKENTPSNASR